MGFATLAEVDFYRSGVFILRETSDTKSQMDWVASRRMTFAFSWLLACDHRLSFFSAIFGLNWEGLALTFSVYSAFETAARLDSLDLCSSTTVSG